MNAKVEILLKRIALFFGLLLLASAILAGLAFLYFRYGVFSGGLVDSGATAVAWFDEDGDGQRDPGESPLAGVCIWAGTILSPYGEPWLLRKCAADYGYGLSGASGQWPANRQWLPFFAGAHCSDVHIYAVSPPGYYATTPLVVNGCDAQFGLNTRGSGIWAPPSVPRPQELVAALQRRQALATGLRVTAVIAIPLAVIAGAAFAAISIVRK